MRKIFLMVLSLAMIFSFSTVVFAAETNDTTLIYNNEASYEISIPAESVINKVTGKGTVNIAVTDTNLADNMFVAISVSSNSFDSTRVGEDDEGAAYDGVWHLSNTEKVSDKIGYLVSVDDVENYISSGDRIFEMDSPTDCGLHITLLDDAKVGSYTDTLTFTSEIIKLIDFSYDSTDVQAEEGMTFEDWFASSYNIENLNIDEYTIHPIGDIYTFISKQDLIEANVSYNFQWEDSF